VAAEASNLYSLLASLRFRVEEPPSNDPRLNQVKRLGGQERATRPIQRCSRKRVEQVSSSRRRDQVKSALTWKFAKLEVEDALKQMERLKSLIQCALTEDLL
jgi:hypothetical protein